MSTQRWRLPAGLRTPPLIPLPGEATDTADLFEVTGPGVREAHPVFLARLDIWRDQMAGLISFAEAQRRSANVGRAVEERQRQQEAASRPRMARPEPPASRQYAGEMATTAARDDRLTPNAKAFLQVLRARCGRGRRTEFTKATMGDVLSRSTRSIRRYLADLETLGYIVTKIRKTARGLHTGLVVTITDAVMPFYEEPKGLARWLAETPAALLRPFEAVFDPVRARVTNLSPKNQVGNDISRLRRILLSKTAGSSADPPR